MTTGDAEAGTSVRALYARPAAEWPSPVIAPGIGFVELGALERQPPAPEALARLGERLFHEPRLSATGDVSCASCHQPAAAWADGRPLPAGAPLSGRNVPSLFSSAYRRSLGWDGARTSLREQSLRPLLARHEMGNADLAGVAARLRAMPDLEAPFAAAFGGAPVEPERIAEALAAFQSGLEQETRFDRFMRGDRSALDDREIQGLHLFRTRAGCANCHFGPLLTDEGFHNLGLSAAGEPREDFGRYRVTGRVEDVGRFRTPSLRHVARTAPYMHGGLFPTLAGVVNFYDRGGGEPPTRSAAEALAPLHRAAVRTDPLLRPLALDATEKAALVAFLGTL
ncbi:cytochrome c peroxidase [Ancylobacter sp. G4_0304]